MRGALGREAPSVMTHSHGRAASCQMVVVPSDTLYFSLKHTVEIRVAFDECEKTMHWGSMERLPAASKLQCEIASENP